MHILMRVEQGDRKERLSWLYSSGMNFHMVI